MRQTKQTEHRSNLTRLCSILGDKFDDKVKSAIVFYKSRSELD